MIQARMPPQTPSTPAGLVGASVLTPPDEAESVKNSLSVLDESLAAMAAAVAATHGPAVDVTRESCRILSFTTSRHATRAASKMTADHAKAHPGERLYINILYVLPAPSASDTLPVHGLGRLESGQGGPATAPPSPPSPAPRTDYFSDTFESYVRNHAGPVVAPRSIHYSFCLSFLPTHVLPDFASRVRQRAAELCDGGILILAHPTSLAFFHDTVLPAVGAVLLTQLALQKTTTATCESLSRPPRPVPGFDSQQAILADLGLEILHAEERKVAVDSWPSRWLADEQQWIAQITPTDTANPLELKNDLINGLYQAANHTSGVSVVGIYAIRKR